ncbi:MAG: ABC transporter permease [Candidatus Eremiobacterota bacterium]
MNDGELFILIVSILSAAIRSGTPVLFATVGEIFTEKSGVLNLGLEGMILTGAVTGYAVNHYTGSLFLGVLAGVLAGGLISLIHAFLTVTLRANQVVSGIALTIFGTGLSGLFGKNLVGIPTKGFTPIAIPVLSDIPVIGTILFNQDILVYFSYVFIPLCNFYIFKTRPGLYMRSTGENPRTADSLGINVSLIRYLYIFTGGLLCGLGGVYLSLAYTPMWVQDMSAGRGWIAIALVIFATWNPVKAAAGAYLFGGVDALQLRIQATGIANIPAPLLKMLPYIFTILVLLIATKGAARKRIGAPAALGIPYVREERG